MTLIVCDPQGTDLHWFDQESLSIDSPYHASKVEIDIETVRTHSETNTDAEYFVYLFARSIDLTDINPAWVQHP